MCCLSIRWWIKKFWNYSHISLNIRRNYMKLVQSTKLPFPNFVMMFKWRSTHRNLWHHRFMKSCTSDPARKMTEIFKPEQRTIINILCYLKLYCGYLYTRPCMINRIWGLKQLWLQVNGHAWFHLHGIHLPVRNGAEGAKNQNENICLQRDSNPRLVATRLVEQRFRPLGYDTLMKITLINVLLDSWIKLIKPLRDNTGQSDCDYIIHVLLNWLSD